MQPPAACMQRERKANNMSIFTKHFLCHNFCTFEYIMDPLRFKKKDKFDQIEKDSPNHLKSAKFENPSGLGLDA